MRSSIVTAPLLLIAAAASPPVPTPAPAPALTGEALVRAILPEANRTEWRPGIPGGVPRVPRVFRRVDPGLGDGRTDAAPAINQAIQEAGDRAAESGEHQVVLLPAGVYRLSRQLDLNRSLVILRGEGPTRTRLRLDTADEVPVIRLGIFWPEYQEKAWRVVGTAPKGSRSITLRAGDAEQVEPGDVLEIDQQDDATVWLLDGHYHKRQPAGDANGPGTGARPFRSVDQPGGPWRSVGQQIEVVKKRPGKGDTTVLELSTPLHVSFEEARVPEVFLTAAAREGRPGVRSSGVEHLYVTGGNQGNISGINLAYSWVADVESDGDPRTRLPGTFRHPGGMSGEHVSLAHSFRCEIRDSYVHHARSINQGGGAYGISLSSASSDNLIENDIAVHLNKPIVMNRSGGGNVVAYSYVDDAYSTSFAGWQESALDGNHQTFSHHDLFEGNWATNLGADSTHGNCGWHTFFRNHAPGRNSSPPAPDQGNVRAVGVDGFVRGMAFVGNVLLLQPFEVNGYLPAYECTSNRLCMRGAAVFRLGANVGEYGGFDDGTAARTTYRHGNYDPVSGEVVWDPAVAARALPDSLYLSGKPSFFGDRTWPWVNPLGQRKVLVLPAKERYDRMPRR